jgi:hypothetical protein
VASFTERINVIIDVATQKATTGLKDFRKSVGDAEGFTGKLKAGASSLSATLGGLGPEAVAGAATVAAGAAVKMAGEFSALGVEVGKFSDATGMSTEESSRWIEVANDLGVSTEGLQGILGKLNKNVDPKLFASYGISIARAADGTVNANQTFLNTLDVLNRMKDPAERAKTAAKLLGRGWQDAAELIGMSAKEVKDRLDDVSDSKVFDQDKVAKAKKYRDAMDSLRDAFQDITLELGEALVPALSDVADGISKITSVAGPAIHALDALQNSDVGGWLDSALNWPSEVGGAIADGIGILKDGVGEFDAFGKKFKVTNDAVGTSADQAAVNLYALNDRAHFAAVGLDEEAAAGDRAKEATKKLAKATQDLNDIQKDAMGLRADIVTQSLDLMAAQAEYNASLKDGTSNTIDLAKQANDLATRQADLAAAQDKANGKTQTASERAAILKKAYEDLQKGIEKGSPLWNAIEAYKQSLNTIPTNIRTTLSINDAAGRPISTNGGAGVSGAGQKTPDGERSSRSINVTVNTGADPNAVVRVIKEYQRRGGVI